MKIVVTGTRGIPDILGGVETHCEKLYPKIAQKEYEIHLVRRKNYVSAPLEIFKGIHLIDIDSPKKKSFEAIVHTWRAIWRAKKLNADIIHIHAIGPALLVPFARVLGLKVVFTHHGPDYDREKWGMLAKMILKCGESIGCRFSNEIIAISTTIKEIIENKYKRKDVHLIYNGVPEPQLIASSDYFEELRIQPNKYIFAMGRFVPEKRFHDLISAYIQLENKDYKLVIAGDADFTDEYSTSLKELAHNHNVILPGFIKGDKLHTLLTNARMFVIPSSHEGLPIALLEAMSYGLPIIASDIPANLEVNLDSLRYFKTGNVDELKGKMDLFLNQENVRVNYNMDKYNWNFIANQIISVYDRLK